MTNDGIGKQVVARTPAVVGGMLRNLVEFAIDRTTIWRQGDRSESAASQGRT